MFKKNVKWFLNHGCLSSLEYTVNTQKMIFTYLYRNILETACLLPEYMIDIQLIYFYTKVNNYIKFRIITVHRNSNFGN